MGNVSGLAPKRTSGGPSKYKCNCSVWLDTVALLVTLLRLYVTILMVES